MTRCPRSRANCAARLPTAPAAAETHTTSPSRSAATSNSPAYAVSPIRPRGPRYAWGGAGGHCGDMWRAQSSERAERAARGRDCGVVAPAVGVPDRVAHREAVRPGLDHLPDGHDPVHRRVQPEGAEVARRCGGRKPDADRRIDARPRVAHEHLALTRLRERDRDVTEVAGRDGADRVAPQPHLARHRAQARVASCCATATISGTRTSFTRGRLCGSPAATSWSSIAFQPAHVTSPGTRPRSHASTSAPSSYVGVLRRAAAASSNNRATVSVAHFLLVPMTPDGPRLTQPAAYSPGSGAPSSAMTRPASLRITPRRWSNGTPGSGRPR